MLTPTVLKCELHDNDFQVSQKVRIVKDYEFDYYIRDGRTLEQNGKLYKPSAGTLVFRKPGDLAKGTGIFHCYMLTVDFSETKSPDYYIDRETESVMQPLCDVEPISQLPVITNIYHMEECNYLMKRLMALTFPKQSAKALDLIRSLTMELIYLVATDYYRYQAKSDSFVSSKFLEICNYIQINYKDNITLDSLAQKANLEKSYFSRAFTKEIGRTPMEYINAIRMENAKFFLSSTNYSIREVSEMCGFNSEAYFSACFKHSVGQTPLNYRRQVLYSTQARVLI